MNKEKNRYYVYAYIRLDSKSIFYIGKGTNDRAKRIKEHNDFCKRIAKKHGFRIIYLFLNLTEMEAFSKEREYVKFFKKLHFCEANHTDGGQGCLGIKPSVKTMTKNAKAQGAAPFEVYTIRYEFVGIWEVMGVCARDLGLSRQLISRILHKQGRNNSTGGYFFRYVGDTTPLVDLYLPPIEAGSHQMKQIIDLETGKIWKCAKDASKDLNISRTTLCGRLNGSICNKSSLRYMDDREKPLKEVKDTRRKVIDIVTGQIWGSIKDAAKELNLKPNTLCNWISGKRRNKTNLRYMDKSNFPLE